MRITVLLTLLCYTAGELRDQLHYFETLKHVDVRVRKKRSVDGLDGEETKDVTFSAFGKDFNLVLTPGSPVISADFVATLVYKDGQTSRLFVNENDFFTGHLAEDEAIKADAHVEDGLWTANIYDTDEVYTLEPSWRHLPPSDNHSMIVYRHSDIKWNNIFPDLDQAPNKRKKICGALYAEDEPDYDWDREKEAEQEDRQREEDGRYKYSSRHKRAVPGYNTCHVLAVADYTFFLGPGGGFPHRTANYIIQTMQTVNHIYRNTVWSSDLTGLGFQIKELRIHPELTNPSEFHDNDRHYNMYDGSIKWPDHDLLKQFGEDPHVNTFCLAHLFTHRKFDDGVLGLAYIASPRKYAVGGICSYYRQGDRAYNIGFSSTMNTKRNNLLTQEAQLVTAHEFGHNWGAEHDAETSECAPSAFNNGKYIMYTYAVSGYDENNEKFSPCSKRYISAVLSTRSRTCFKEEDSKRDPQSANVPMCGNGIIDKGEQCDGGGMGLSGFDSCCSKDCKFLGDAECSPVNFECCKDCKMVRQKGTIECRGARQELCEEAAYCTGTSLDCPPSKPMSNYTSCIDEGKCMGGECLDFCAFNTNKQMRPCRCEEDATSCLRCCKPEDGGVCKPLNDSKEHHLPPGRPCSYGYCEAGKCKRGKANMIQRLFSFIERLDSSTLVAFMKSNIVGTIIVFSLIVWIPASWAISCIDKRNERKAREEESRWGAIIHNQYQDFKIRDSNIHHIERSYRQASPLVERKYKFNHEPETPLQMETSI